LEQVFPPSDELFSSIAVKFFLMAGGETVFAGGSSSNMVQYSGQKHLPPSPVRLHLNSVFSKG
jgi:hypothetical protein